MRFDWQAITVALIILAAAVYVARRGLARLRSFRPGAKGGTSACGGCAKEETVNTKRPATVLVQIASHKPTSQRRAR